MTKIDTGTDRMKDRETETVTEVILRNWKTRAANGTTPRRKREREREREGERERDFNFISKSILF